MWLYRRMLRIVWRLCGCAFIEEYSDLCESCRHVVFFRRMLWFVEAVWMWFYRRMLWFMWKLYGCGFIEKCFNLYGCCMGVLSTALQRTSLWLFPHEPQIKPMTPEPAGERVIHSSTANFYLIITRLMPKDDQCFTPTVSMAPVSHCLHWTDPQ